MNDEGSRQLLNSTPRGRFLLQRKSRYVKLKEDQQSKLIRLTKIMLLGRWTRFYGPTSSEQASRLAKSIEFWGYLSDKHDSKLKSILWGLAIKSPK